MRWSALLIVTGWVCVGLGVLLSASHFWTLIGFAQVLGDRASVGEIAGAAIAPLPYYLVWVAIGAGLLMLASHDRRLARLEGKS